MRNTPSNGDNVIDSRDVVERIKELESLRDDALQALADEPEKGWFTDDMVEYGSTPDWTEDEHKELKVLLALQDEAEGCADWRHGETLIRDSYFEDYARELADDIGAVDRNAKWPNDCIDWERAARELQMDYTSVEFDGVTYWIRS